VTLELAGIDLSATAIKHTRQRTTAAGLSVKLEQRDALGEALSDGFDVVTCSLFLHHLRSDQAVELLRRMSAATTRLVLVNDLRRSAGAWLLASAACRLLSRSPIVHIDGPRSVSAAFNLAEASELVEKAGLIGAVVARRWPFRYLLAWDRATT
jgi:2-polyprenyl-3-methyl-5-hydroxy-6-metoxy-1,4-benzoquinol methylase